MSRLDTLLQELCPDGVEYKRLEEVCSVITDGSHASPLGITEGYYMPSVKDMRENGFDFSQCKQISKQDYDALVRNGCRPQIGDLLVAKDGSMLKYAFAVKEDLDVVLLSSIAIFRPIKGVMDASYLGYYITSKRIKKSVIQNYSTKGGVPRIVLKNFRRVEIPVPPLEVQREIVRILDKFTQLKAELSAELSARRVQYEYYRNELLTFGDDVPLKSIGEICSVSAGGDAPKDAMSKEKEEGFEIPIVSNGIGDNALYGYTNIAKITEPAVTVAARGTIGYAEYRDYPYYPIIRLLTVMPKNNKEVHTKYLYYCLAGKEYSIPQGGIPQLTAPMLKKELIPIPSIDKQKEIIRILDRFNCITTDIYSGIPAEIEARTKQYEFYRDKLLSFKRKEVS